MPFNEDLEPKGKKGKRLRILSIDGGAVRGIIPAIILQELERYLASEEAKTPGNTGEHHLSEYFDLIAGTSSGGLITAMITTRKLNDRRVPVCNASQVVEFFKKDAARIFPATITDKFRLHLLLEGFASVFGPIYSAKPLEDLLLEKFGDRHLSEAFTSVVIPAYDTKKEVPVFFSKQQGVYSAKPLYDVQVKDACRATTAVPIFFPAANFKVEVSGDPDQPARTKEFNVIDGGIAVNDPTLVAVTQAMAKKRQDIFDEELRAITEGDKPISDEERQAIADRQLTSQEEPRAVAEERARYCMDFSNVLVLSLGTGQHPMRFIAKPHWSSVQWLLNPWGSPLLNSFLSASEDMVEYYTSMIFDANQSGHNYLRIQTERLSTSEFWGIDDATKQNLDELTQKARELLKKKEVSKRNFATGELHAIPDGGSNEQALRRFARWLVEERRERPVQQPSQEQQQTAGETGGTPELPGNPGQQTAVDRYCSRMRAVHGWFCLMMRTEVGGFCLTMGTALGGVYLIIKALIIIFLCVLGLPALCILEVMCDAASKLLRMARIRS